MLGVGVGDSIGSAGFGTIGGAGFGVIGGAGLGVIGGAGLGVIGGAGFGLIGGAGFGVIGGAGTWAKAAAWKCIPSNPAAQLPRNSRQISLTFTIISLLTFACHTPFGLLGSRNFLPFLRSS